VAEISRLTKGMNRSGIRVIMELAASMGEGTIRLEAGEPMFPTPSHIIDAATHGAKEGFTKYTPNAGFFSLRHGFAESLRRDYGLRTQPENVVVSVGGVGAMSSALRVLTDLGDEVLIPDPGWPNYESIALCAGNVVLRYPLNPLHGFIPSLSDLERVMTDKVKVLIINSPSNPLGVVYPEKTIKELYDFARQKDIFILSDEVYDKILFNGEHFTPLSYDTDGRVIGIYSCSKTYAMTGWRVGFAVASEEIVKEMNKSQEAYFTCAPSINQKAAEAALNGPQECVGKMVQAYKANMLTACRLLDDLGLEYVRPQGAFYIFINVGCDDSLDFAVQLLQKFNVAVAPGKTFGPSAERFIRISLASSNEDITLGIQRLGEFLQRQS
jgi:aspartate/methionine/tyrosine aminotransferase